MTQDQTDPPLTEMSELPAAPGRQFIRTLSRQYVDVASIKDFAVITHDGDPTLIAAVDGRHYEVHLVRLDPDHADRLITEILQQTDRVINPETLYAALLAVTA